MFNVGLSLIFHIESLDLNSECNPKGDGTIGPLFTSSTKYKDGFVERSDLSNKMKKRSKYFNYILFLNCNKYL